MVDDEVQFRVIGDPSSTVWDEAVIFGFLGDSIEKNMLQFFYIKYATNILKY